MEERVRRMLNPDKRTNVNDSTYGIYSYTLFPPLSMKETDEF